MTARGILDEGDVPPEAHVPSQREESPEVMEGGASRRGSEHAAMDQARCRGRFAEPRAGGAAGSRASAERRVGWEAGTRTPKELPT